MTDLFKSSGAPDSDNTGNQNYLDQFVGEGKKYASVDELAKGMAHAQAFIETLKSDNEFLKNDLKSRITMEEFLEKNITMSKPESNSSNPANETATGKDSSSHTVVAQALSKDDVMAIVIQALQQETSKAARERNVNETLAKLREVYGDDYRSKVATKAQELGVGTEFLSSLAGQSPKAFLELVGAMKGPQKVDPSFTPPQTRQNPSVPSQPNASGARNKAYYDQLRKNNLNEYLSARVQSQIHKDAIALGADFYK